MEKSLFSFIWKHSRRDQLWLLALTLLTFPFLYVSLELPKRIINDAIGAPSDQIDLMGWTLTKVEYLLLLSFAFLGTVLIGGLMKMHLNTRKGVVSERMLRRLRYQLINRMMRFPVPYFRSTSQGELVSMITSESEPMGGLMGDAIAQPVFQFGQMATIVTFLFMQNVWFGLASVALIPLQAWLIPRLQRQINLLNKDRIVEVRHLATEIGESAAGIADLRANGGWRFRLALITDRLGRLFEIRFRIYRKKFFMKFLNNFITQLTPFLFYAIGGVLAIRGQITVGALVAALGAYKDLSSPWKELLTYYNQVQDMSLRWKIVTDRFAPSGMIPEDKFEGEPGSLPHLQGAIELKDVTVQDEDGNTVLEDITLTIPPGARVAIQSDRDNERAAFGELLTREVLPVRGQVTLSGHALNDLHQAVISARVGYAHSRPYLFDGTLGDNLMMPLKIKPQEMLWDPYHRDRRLSEARRSGNSPDPLHASWIDPDIAGLADGEDVRAWWFELVEAMGLDEFMFRRTLRSTFDPQIHPGIAREVVRLRPQIKHRLQEAGLAGCMHRLDPDVFNPTVPLGANLLFAAPRQTRSQADLIRNPNFVTLLHEAGLVEESRTIALGVVETLSRTFGRDGTDHPLFLRLGIKPETYHRLVDIAARQKSEGWLPADDLQLLLTLPFLLSADQIGSDFPEEFKDRIMDLRRSQPNRLRNLLGEELVPVDETLYIPQMTVIENAIYGRVLPTAGARADEIEDLVAEVLNVGDLRRRLAAIIHDLPTGLGGAKLPAVFQERAAFSRAGIKRPDILVLNHALASHDSASRHQTRQRLRELMPRTTMIFLEDRFDHPEAYDLHVEIRDGRIDGVKRAETDESPDLSRKIALIAATDLFSKLDSRNQRLLAFSAQWHDVAKGDYVYRQGQKADAVYLCLGGQFELRVPGDSAPIAEIDDGEVIGQIEVLTRGPRVLDLVAKEPARFLRIGADEFRAVIESDMRVAISLLETLAEYLTEAADVLPKLAAKDQAQ